MYTCFKFVLLIWFIYMLRSVTSIFAELEHMFVLIANCSPSPRVGFYRCIEDILLALCCFLLFGLVVDSLTHSPFPI